MKKPRVQFAAALLAALLAAGSSLRAQEPLPLEEELARLPRLGPIFYITAHPDDESAAVITYLVRGLHARVVLLAMTRGEGGQNQVGPELGEDLARVRTAELERAVAGYGAEVRFLGAADFGFSKSVEETFRVWDENKLLGELVRQIRALRPLVVLSAWTGTSADGGGAHHQAAGMLARRAFELAGDPKAFPEQLAHGYEPWQPRYLLVRAGTGGDATGTIEVPVQELSPVAGKTYAELGWQAFQNHRSQGLHQVPIPRQWRQLLRLTGVRPADLPEPKRAADLVPELAALPELFPSVERLASWRERLGQVAESADKARELRAQNKPGEAALALVQGAALLAALRRELEEDDSAEAAMARALLDDRQNQFLQATAHLAGVELEASTDRAVVTPGSPDSGERLWVRLAVHVGKPEVFRAAGFGFGPLRLATPADWLVEPAQAETTPAEQRAEYSVGLPESLDPARVPATPLRAQATLTTGSLQLELSAPVRGLARASAPALEPVSVTPAVTLELEPPLRLVRAAPGETTYDWCVRLEAHRPQIGKVSVWLEVPNGWNSPLPVEIPLGPPAQARTCFSLTLPGHLAAGRYELRAAAAHGREQWTLARRERLGASNEPPYRFEPAGGPVELLDIDIPPGLRVGYIGFNDDPVPALLAQLGVGVDLLDEGALAKAQLNAYDSVVISDRAYDYRADLAGQNARLLDYVKAGGTLLVEHQGRNWDPAKLAPYPGVKPASNLRVTDETAAVKVLAPEYPVLTFPNHIGEADWKGWVQERGLYFWESWAEQYTPLVELADPGEAPQRGALLYARYGEGVYIYSGLALFRQVRAGVPGGVRLYVNLLSQRRAAKPEARKQGDREAGTRP